MASQFGGFGRARGRMLRRRAGAGRSNRGVTAGRTLAVGLVTMGMVTTGMLGASIAAASAQTDGPTKTVTYRDLSLEVPSSWPVYDLEASPQTCVRYDRHALYLGSPGSQQDCPARAVGRTEAVLVQPAESGNGLRAGASLAKPGAAPSVADTGGTDRQAQIALSGTGLVVTAAYRDQPAVSDAIVDSMSYDGPVRKTPFQGTEGAATPKYPAPATATRAHGKGFDTCTAPSASTLHAWKKSSYRTVGIYIGGLNRACGDGNLDAGWVRRVARDGWHLLPIYVGRQASCAFQDGLGPISASKAGRQGRNAAADAVKRARHFGLHSGSAIYFDMEGYNDTKTRCRRAVLRFLTGWTERLHDSGFLSGVYSSAASGIKNLSDVYNSSHYTRPDAIWTARWDGKATVWGEEFVPGKQWNNHQRAKQYRGPHTETWGGRSINIDSDVIDTAVGSAHYRHSATAKASLHTRRGPSTSSKVTGTRAPGSAMNVMCQVTGQKVHSSRVWDKLHNGSYVSDYYVNTKSSTGYARAIPRCTYPYQVTASLLHQRTGPSTSHKVKGSIPFGGLAYIVCQDRGQKVGKTRVWDKLTNGTWISDHYVKTPGRPGYTRPIARCP